MSIKPIAVGCDHAAVQLKLKIIEHLKASGFAVNDLGCNAGEKCDYPDVAALVCKEITENNSELGILICGTGIGMSMSANKVNGIRAAACSDGYSAKYTRLHNDANVLCIGARVLGEGLALELCDVFLSTEFEGGRHAERVKKIIALEEK